MLEAAVPPGPVLAVLGGFPATAEPGSGEEGRKDGYEAWRVRPQAVRCLVSVTQVLSAEEPGPQQV